MTKEMGERRCVYRVQAGKSEGKKPPARPVFMRVYEIQLLVRGMRGVDWTGLIWPGHGQVAGL
jgi:hypothetical protein